MIQPDRMQMLEKYAAITGTRVDACIDEALHDWLTSTAVARISQNEKKSKMNNVVCISDFKR